MRTEVTYKQKSIWLQILMTIVVMFMSSCDSHTAGISLDPFEYQQGTDMQYFHISYSSKISRIQDHKNGCCFYHDGFLYSFDVKQKTIIPVCSKANCLHDRESDPVRRKACHAFVSDQNPDVVSVMLYQDQVFICIDRLSGRQTYGTVDRLTDGHSLWLISITAVRIFLQYDYINRRK